MCKQSTTILASYAPLIECALACTDARARRYTKSCIKKYVLLGKTRGKMGARCVVPYQN